VFEDTDLVATPTLPAVPPRSQTSEDIARRQLIRFTFPFNVVGLPAIAVPCGSGRRPVSIQIVGAPGRDDLVLGAANALFKRLRLDERSTLCKSVGETGKGR
jgi:aspartyl-tRNA(Asn)/glutamyl-tRNA(Gln) amidotransferase subunit A